MSTIWTAATVTIVEPPSTLSEVIMCLKLAVSVNCVVVKQKCSQRISMGLVEYGCYQQKILIMCVSLIWKWKYNEINNDRYYAKPKHVASSIADSIRCYDDQQSLSPGVPLAVLITSFHAQWKRYHLRCTYYTSGVVIIAVCFHKNCEAKRCIH